ncbi:MAG: hypothetical protein NDF55_01820 [archaeon GB-1867-005]|nr:hypothetical protein [Candidatus Culexmicrobium cathedralense]
MFRFRCVFVEVVLLGVVLSWLYLGIFAVPYCSLEIVNVSLKDFILIVLLLLVPVVVLASAWSGWCIVEGALSGLSYFAFTSPSIALLLQPFLYWMFFPAGIYLVLTSTHNLIRYMHELCGYLPAPLDVAYSLFVQALVLPGSLLSLIMPYLLLYGCVAGFIAGRKWRDVPLSFVGTLLLIGVGAFLAAISMPRQLLEYNPLYFVFIFNLTSWMGLILFIAGMSLFAYATTYYILCRIRGVDVISGGPYRVIRHPQYLGLISFSLGISVVASTLSFETVIYEWFYLMLIYLWIARVEERELANRFGRKYKDYKAATYFLFPLKII